MGDWTGIRRREGDLHDSEDRDTRGNDVPLEGAAML